MNDRCEMNLSQNDQIRLCFKRKLKLFRWLTRRTDKTVERTISKRRHGCKLAEIRSPHHWHRREINDHVPNGRVDGEQLTIIRPLGSHNLAYSTLIVGHFGNAQRPFWLSGFMNLQS